MLQGVSLHGCKENLSYEDNTRVRGIHPAGKEMALRLEEHALEYVLATFRGWWWGISVAHLGVLLLVLLIFVLCFLPGFVS